MEVKIFMGIVCMVVVGGNFFVLYALISQPSLHTTTNFLVLSLTISDLLLGICIIPFAIIQEHSQRWLFGNVGCRIWLTADVWLSTASIYNLLAISFDRYMAVRQPIRYPSILSKRVTPLLVFLVWGSAGIPALCLFVFERHHIFPEHECTPMKLSSPYIICSAIASFVVPAITMVTKQYPFDLVISEVPAIPNTVDNAKLFGKDSAIDENHETVCSLNLKRFLSQVMVLSLIGVGKKRDYVLSQINGDRTRAGFSRIALRTELRVARTTAVVVAVFIICWIPFSTIYTLQAYSTCRMPDCVSKTMYLVAFWLGYSNSAMNPLLYAAFSRDIRAVFRKLLCGKMKSTTV